MRGRKKNTPFLQPFTYMEINLNIIYMATDYSMYKAKRKEKLKAKTEESHRSFIFGTILVNSPKRKKKKKHGVILAETQILTVPGSCPLTKIGPSTEYSH